MASMGIQVVGIALSVLGWLGTILCCGLPMWRVTAYGNTNILLVQMIWEGLWMDCVVQSTGQMQCNIYESMLALPQDMQAARALVVIAIVLAIVGVVFSVLGGKCTNCMEDEGPKARVIIGAGVSFLLSALLLLIPLCWIANNIIRDYYNPMVPESQKRAFGYSLYIGWASCAMLLIGGALLCYNCPLRKEKPYSAKYTATRSVPASNYV
ncbi:claudin-4-like [Elgaria multicarinata webbii]|uniref:claudin-4-like n=1 Tax=Elgaria multicarinata webbii TaxID=159646 RepID=UPI002FCD4313